MCLAFILWGPNGLPIYIGIEAMTEFLKLHMLTLLSIVAPPVEHAELEPLPVDWDKESTGSFRKTIRKAVKCFTPKPRYKNTPRPPYWPQDSTIPWQSVESGFDNTQPKAIIRHMYAYAELHGTSGQEIQVPTSPQPQLSDSGDIDEPDPYGHDLSNGAISDPSSSQTRSPVHMDDMR